MGTLLKLDDGCKFIISHIMCSRLTSIHGIYSGGIGLDGSLYRAEYNKEPPISCYPPLRSSILMPASWPKDGLPGCWRQSVFWLLCFPILLALAFCELIWTPVRWLTQPGYRQLYFRFAIAIFFSLFFAYWIWFPVKANVIYLTQTYPY